LILAGWIAYSVRGKRFGEDLARKGGMAAFSDQLRRERERRGLAIDEICETTKVSPRYIRAVEAGNFAEIPGGVFRKSFVRSYIGALGLDEAIWMGRFEQSCRDTGLSDPGDTQWVTFAENVKRGRGSMHYRIRWGTTALRTLAIFIVLSLAGWCGWRLVSHQRLVPSSPAWLHSRHRGQKASVG
jgi:cytoskeleton protein RodZ